MENLELIKKYVDILFATEVSSLIIKGPSGIGKTEGVLSKLKELNLEEDRHFVYITGYMTPLSLYNILGKSRILEEPKLLIFDDIDSILKNKACISLLKSALAEARGKRIVSYESTSTKVESNSFEFTGTVILIVNSLSGNAVDPLLDRGIYYDIEFDPVAMSKHISDNLESFYGNKLHIEEKRSIWEKVKRFIDAPNFSIRALNRAFMFYMHDRDNWYEMWLRTMKR